MGEERKSRRKGKVRGWGLGGNDWRHMLALKQDRVRQRGGRSRTRKKREGQWDMKTKRKTERKNCREMRLIAALGHVTVALFIIPSPLLITPTLHLVFLEYKMGCHLSWNIVVHYLCKIFECSGLCSFWKILVQHVVHGCISKVMVLNSYARLFPVSQWVWPC